MSLLEGYIDRATLAQELRVTDRTIYTYENQPDGLPSLMVGSRKLYRIEAVRAWLAMRERGANKRRGV